MLSVHITPGALANRKSINLRLKYRPSAPWRTACPWGRPAGSPPSPAILCRCLPRTMTCYRRGSSSTAATARQGRRWSAAVTWAAATSTSRAPAPPTTPRSSFRASAATPPPTSWTPSSSTRPSCPGGGVGRATSEGRLASDCHTNIAEGFIETNLELLLIYTVRWQAKHLFGRQRFGTTQTFIYTCNLLSRLVVQLTLWPVAL